MSLEEVTKFSGWIAGGPLPEARPATRLRDSAGGSLADRGSPADRGSLASRGIPPDQLRSRIQMRSTCAAAGADHLLVVLRVGEATPELIVLVAVNVLQRELLDGGDLGGDELVSAKGRRACASLPSRPCRKSYSAR